MYGESKMIEKFTIVLPIKGTKEEDGFMERSIHSAFDLNPDEIIIALDEGVSKIIEARVDFCCQSYSGKRPCVRKIYTSKDPQWSFQLANIIWNCYSKANNDRIFSFDIDSVVRKDVLKGLPQLKDDVALVSFTKKLHIGTIPDLIRFIFYRIRVKTNESVFSGNYWVDRTKFFDLIDKNDYMKLKNGVDTYLTEKIRQSRYTMINRKDMGVTALSKQNEDYDWRQFMDGVWFYANRDKIKAGTVKRGVLKRGFFRRHPKLLVLLKSTVYQRYGILRGFNWASKNQKHETVVKASTVDLYEWGYFGTKYLPKLKFKDTGTGHHEY